MRRCEIMNVVALFSNFFNLLRIAASVSVSTALKLSSKISIGLPLIIVLAIATRCFCPPERVTPFSPTAVSYPSSKLLITSCTEAILAALKISFSSVSEVANLILSLSVFENKNGSCSTMPIFSRKTLLEIFFTSIPSSLIDPS